MELNDEPASDWCTSRFVFGGTFWLILVLTFAVTVSLPPGEWRPLLALAAFPAGIMGGVLTALRHASRACRVTAGRPIAPENQQKR